jgi:hypothetical protein
MNRLKKVALLSVKRLSYLMRFIRLYYWSEEKLYLLRAVYVMPKFFYRWLHRLYIWMADFRKFLRPADMAIHTIPYHMRLELA